MKALFSFGKSGIDVSIPDGYRAQVILSHTARALDDEQAALDAALDAPIGCEPLLRLAEGKKQPPSPSATLPARRRIRSRCRLCCAVCTRPAFPSKA